MASGRWQRDGQFETMAGLRALCALVPQAKAAFTEMKGIQTLSNYIDFAAHGGNVAYNAVYTIAALCDDEDAAHLNQLLQLHCRQSGVHLVRSVQLSSSSCGCPLKSCLRTK